MNSDFTPPFVFKPYQGLQYSLRAINMENLVLSSLSSKKVQNYFSGVVCMF